jgi:hypothetical protein
MPKPFKSAIHRPTDAQVLAATQPIPFAKCHSFDGAGAGHGVPTTRGSQHGVIC